MTDEQGDQEAKAAGIDVPRWIEQDITLYTVEAINQGGCASGAYMPAVTYHDATQAMAEHGDDVLEFIEEGIGELPMPEQTTSWGGLACHFLSCAVELWASGVEIPDDEEEATA
jgi:hypothetical protein